MPFTWKVDKRHDDFLVIIHRRAILVLPFHPSGPMIVKSWFIPESMPYPTRFSTIIKAVEEFFGRKCCYSFLRLVCQNKSCTIELDQFSAYLWIYFQITVNNPSCLINPLRGAMLLRSTGNSSFHTPSFSTNLLFRMSPIPFFVSQSLHSFLSYTTNYV